MGSEVIALSIYSMPLLLLVVYYGLRKRRSHKASRDMLAQSIEAKLTEPASLHPKIDLSKCIGCGSCVTACPEHDVLGLIDRQAHLINPTDCIGHGACKTACPNHAIELVFGTASRGVEIPELTPQFESNIPGLFIAGELGGMGLIKNAIEQGRQAMSAITDFVKGQSVSGDLIDCVIVGAGPAGLSAMLGAKECQLKVVTIDQSGPGGTVSHYPRGKLVMTAPADMPLVGKVKFSEVSKEKLLSFWLNIIEQHQLNIHQNETLLDIDRQTDGSFIVVSDKNQYHAKSVLLAMGRRGTPRKLDVPGEELTKVVYQMTDSQQYNQDDVLVVGGGDSALEAACAIAELGRCRVSLSYRRDSFSRAKAKNRLRMQQLVSQDQIQLYLNSQVLEITPTKVKLSLPEQTVYLDNSVVIVCVGGVLPTPLLKKVGIEVMVKYGTA